MNGIDAVVTSLLANRVDSLLNLTPGSATASQTGAAGVDTEILNTTPVAPPATPPASAQTALSAVALTLNAIVNSGGEATPAVLGQTPIWPAAPALDVEAGGFALFDTAATPAASSANPNTAATTGTTATANVAAAQVPVAALAAALEQTVGDSGLFYESHLAQWLAGQRPPAALAGEAQNKLVAAAAQLPLDRASDADPASSANATGRPGMGAAPNGPANGAPDGNAAARAMPSIQTAQAARFVAGEVLASSLSDLNGQPAHSSVHSAAAQLAEDGASQNSQSMAAAVHPATVPLVRQQLDLLATGQFRWTGEAWPGAKLDWTIEQEGDEWDRSGGGTASEDGQPWRTRLTLSLPTLGTVDADLTLTGMRLVARVQASPAGAARLAAQGENFRQRLAAAGIELNGLTIREIGGGMPASAAGATGAAAAGQAAASAYARSASAAAAAAAADKAPAARRTARVARPGAASVDDFDWDM
ncbi:MULTISPECIES: flagellar hook-length control protein FliK [Paraburkholderia]|uniref:Flagellar hook-length control protein FliK n=1 Tax=Paraburkholderia madseniana TaxID=2599607 RepID=A0AAP5ENY1_9BURK|nr:MULTISPECIES: flagellar hook-length control protein FliK [Paraburkholderia]MCX4147475.1 flagellar hook-length control protein FliK [Paraburkholderia madseniana]MDN7150418.1 flagellar hook-length control protein FliK [Paraburkholderia sp. WS6]MDQ6409298.1 flagellar hook-length control protein FliK [Paraburkholderia madseniana]